MTEKSANYVFLHGGAQGSWVWTEIIDAQQRQTDGHFGRALALDIPGCGTKRGRKTEAMAFGDVVEELIADIEAAGMDNVVLVGHSQAGNVLPPIAQQKPDLIRQLIYVSCSIPLPGQTVIEMMGVGLHTQHEDQVGWPVDLETTPVRERTEIMLCNDMGTAETRAFMARLGGDHWPAAMYTMTDWAFELPASIDVSYVYCLRDNILPLTWQETFAKRFHAARHLRIDAGHQVMNSHPHSLAEVIRRNTGPI